MVVSGLGQDKSQTNAIVDWVGAGINLKVRQPAVEDIRDAVEKVLDDPKYTQKVMEISKKFDNYDMPKVVDQTIQEGLKKLGK